MKFQIFFSFVLSLLLASASALAQMTGPTIAGAWEGNGEAMYLDGTTAEIVSVTAQLTQEGSFFYGVAEFEVLIGVATVSQQGQFSGYLRGGYVKGVLGGCVQQAPACAGAATFEGRLSGPWLTGTVTDLSDGSISSVTLYRPSY